MPVERRLVEEQLENLGDFRRFFTNKEIRYLPQILVSGERIHGLTSGFFESKTWIIVITDMRLIFLDKGMFYGLRQVDMPLSQIDSISHKTGLLFGEIEVATAAGSKTIGSISKKEVVKVSSIIAGLVHRGGSPSPVPSSSPSRDFVSQIERLSDLRDKGALTDDEFQMAKGRLLDL